ncbi:hypothetical protein [Tessaracoccus rhinocerotis]|nr:hypothetical protein [Tessaracoccus rhinocerotis]
MRNVTATESSRRFSELLDAVERGDDGEVRPVVEAVIRGLVLPTAG